MLSVALTFALVSCSVPAAPLIAAHRGGMDSGYAENTLPAFDHAAAAGAQVIELDLRATADGHTVVLHDASVDRTTNGTGRVRDLTLEDVRRLDAGGGTRVPTLPDVLAATRALSVTLLLDLKPAPGLDLEAVADALRADYEPDRVLFGVRSLDAQQRLASRAPGLHYLGFVPDPDSIESFLAAGVSAIRLWPGWIHRDPDLIRRVKAVGGQVWVTAGPAAVEDLRRLADLGVDALLTDHPAAAVAVFGCRVPPFPR
jgi:glycerophosphoryl diester phosphodiesterase